MEQKQKTILILGAGFAGLHCALRLAKTLTPCEARVVLVDQKTVHLYTPDLYEIATAYNEQVNDACLTVLKDTVAIPMERILKKTRVEFRNDTVTAIDLQKRTVALKKNGPTAYDYLVIALGSVANTYGLPGIAEHAMPFKTVEDALAINCELNTYLHALRQKNEEKEVHIVVGGGGATGVELACELPEYIHKLCKKYKYPRDKIRITIVQGGAELLGMGEQTSCIAMKRCKELGIHVLLGTHVCGATQEEVCIQEKNKTQKKIPKDIFIWTGGVLPHPCTPRELLRVQDTLESAMHPNVFAGGDASCIRDDEPRLAQIAFEQGKHIAENIIRSLRGKPKKPFRYALRGIIIPLGGRYALFQKGTRVFHGRIFWLVRRIVDVGYALSILPFFYALRKWIHDTNIYVGNDE